MLDTITAVDTTDKTFSVTAASASPYVMSVRSLMASADIKPTGKMTIHDIDAKLSKSRLTSTQRISVKVAMERSGLITA
jgi:hypothetical protein